MKVEKGRGALKNRQWQRPARIGKDWWYAGDAKERLFLGSAVREGVYMMGMTDQRDNDCCDDGEPVTRRGTKGRGIAQAALLARLFLESRGRTRRVLPCRCGLASTSEH